eukprot:jgi/Chrzof1/2319/Cz11g10250.t1
MGCLRACPAAHSENLLRNLTQASLSHQNAVFLLHLTARSWQAQVYALGLYVDAAAAKRALHKYRSQPESELVSEQKLYDDLVSADSFEKTLRLVISYGSLKRAQFVNALEERLAPPLTQAGASAVLKDFQSLFDDVNFKKGTEITFTTQGKNKLVTKVDGQQKAVIDSPVLVRSLFDIYLGTDPVSEDAKLSFGKGLAALIKE